MISRSKAFLGKLAALFFAAVLSCNELCHTPDAPYSFNGTLNVNKYNPWSRITRIILFLYVQSFKLLENVISYYVSKI